MHLQRMWKKEVKIHVSIDSLTKDEQIEKLEKEISSFPQVKQVDFFPAVKMN